MIEFLQYSEFCLYGTVPATSAEYPPHPSPSVLLTLTQVEVARTAAYYMYYRNDIARILCGALQCAAVPYVQLYSNTCTAVDHVDQIRRSTRTASRQDQCKEKGEL